MSVTGSRRRSRPRRPTSERRRSSSTSRYRPPRLGELLDIARRAAEADGCRLIPFGHLAEGNVHLNHLGATDTGLIARTVLPEVARLGGTISAEHGIGVAKADYLGIIRSNDDLAAQSAITRALDPRRILNPGVLGR